MGNKPVVARCLVAALLVCAAGLGVRQYRQGGWSSVRVVRADGTRLGDLFDGLRPTRESVRMRDWGRENAQLARRAGRSPWVNEFLDVFDDSVVYAQCNGCTQSNNTVNPQTPCPGGGTCTDFLPPTCGPGNAPFCTGCQSTPNGTGQCTNFNGNTAYCNAYLTCDFTGCPRRLTL
jgi:hypothetical protein